MVQPWYGEGAAMIFIVYQ